MKSEDKKMHLSGDNAIPDDSTDCSNGDSAIKSNRFPPGKSGNTKGRPKGSKTTKRLSGKLLAKNTGLIQTKEIRA